MSNAIYTIMGRTGKTLVVENVTLVDVFDSLFDRFAQGNCDAVKLFKDGEILIEHNLGNIVYQFGQYKAAQYAEAEKNSASFADALIAGIKFTEKLEQEKKNVDDVLPTMRDSDRHRF
jgi:hypothetical protein